MSSAFHIVSTRVLLTLCSVSYALSVLLEVVEAALKKRDHNSHRGGRFGYWGPSIDDGLAGCGVPLYFRAVRPTAGLATHCRPGEDVWQTPFRGKAVDDSRKDMQGT